MNDARKYEWLETKGQMKVSIYGAVAGAWQFPLRILRAFSKGNSKRGQRGRTRLSLSLWQCAGVEAASVIVLKLYVWDDIDYYAAEARNRGDAAFEPKRWPTDIHLRYLWLRRSVINGITMREGVQLQWSEQYDLRLMLDRTVGAAPGMTEYRGVIETHSTVRTHMLYFCGRLTEPD